MKEVVSISLGSSSRDHTATLVLGDQKIRMKRIGTDGDEELYRDLSRELDGTIDCFGAGGYVLSLTVGDKNYEMTKARNLIKEIKETPIVDGSRVKKTIERNALQSNKDI